MAFENVSLFCHDVTADEVDKPYIIPRARTSFFVVPTFDPVIDWSNVSGARGVLIQNKTAGNLYMFYGSVPDNIVDRSDPFNPVFDTIAFKASAFVIGSGQTFEPGAPIGGLLYVLCDAPGCLAHLVS